MMETIEAIIQQGAIRPVFQPLVELYSDRVVGYEALARGPKGPLERPDMLFDSARERGLVFELDHACRTAAVRAAAAAGLRAPATLFVNIEPSAIDMVRGDAAAEVASMPAGIRMVVEITERDWTARVADLLPLVEQLRAHGVGIALDDVGVDRRSLALLPFLRPDVIKLDLRLIQRGLSEDAAEVHSAVSAHAERTGAVVVAEGIETEEHARTARAMGATIGQGWYYGRPGRIPHPSEVSLGEPVPITQRFRTDASPLTPFQLISGPRPVHQASKRLILDITGELERRAREYGDTAVILSTFQHARYFTSRQADRYSALAEDLAFVGALGEDMSEFPALGVRGGRLDPESPLREEWDVTVVAPHFAGALTARDLGRTDCPDMDRQFEFAFTHDRDLVIQSARSLMKIIAPLPQEVSAPALLRAEPGIATPAKSGRPLHSV